LGISKDQSSSWQRLALLSDEEFERALGEGVLPPIHAVVV
jgi:hypothetical protein